MIGNGEGQFTMGRVHCGLNIRMYNFWIINVNVRYSIIIDQCINRITQVYTNTMYSQRKELFINRDRSMLASAASDAQGELAFDNFTLCTREKSINHVLLLWCKLTFIMSIRIIVA